MVTIVDFSSYTRKDGSEFHSLIVEGQLETVQSASTGKSYVTRRKARVPCTFDRETCQSLLGNKLHGSVKKVKCEPYSYTVRSTGEVLTLDYKYQYTTEEPTPEDESLGANPMEKFRKMREHYWKNFGG